MATSRHAWAAAALSTLFAIVAACGDDGNSYILTPNVTTGGTGGTGGGDPGSTTTTSSFTTTSTGMVPCDTGEGTEHACGNGGYGCIECAVSGACWETYLICFNDALCVNYDECIHDFNCWDQVCLDDCAVQFPTGASLYHDILVCVICDECPIDCDAETFGCP